MTPIIPFPSREPVRSTGWDVFKGYMEGAALILVLAVVVAIWFYGLASLFVLVLP